MDPEILQLMWGVVVVGDRLVPRQNVRLRIDLNIDDVIGLLLPIRRARGTAGESDLIGGGENLLQLPEEVTLIELGRVLPGRLDRWMVMVVGGMDVMRRCKV